MWWSVCGAGRVGGGPWEIFMVEYFSGIEALKAINWGNCRAKSEAHLPDVTHLLLSFPTTKPFGTMNRVFFFKLKVLDLSFKYKKNINRECFPLIVVHAVQI